MIVAVGKDGAIGKNGDLIWKISEDLKRFKSLTTGHPVIMGRKTWESLPKKPLPGRKNIILTRNKDFDAPGALVVNSVEEAIREIENETSFIIGGAQVYQAFLPYTTQIDLTLVDETCPEADAFLNLDVEDGWEKVEESDLLTTPTGLSYRYLTLKKKSD